MDLGSETRALQWKEHLALGSDNLPVPSDVKIFSGQTGNTLSEDVPSKAYLLELSSYLCLTGCATENVKFENWATSTSGLVSHNNVLKKAEQRKSPHKSLLLQCWCWPSTVWRKDGQYSGHLLPTLLGCPVPSPFLSLVEFPLFGLGDVVTHYCFMYRTVRHVLALLLLQVSPQRAQ